VTDDSTRTISLTTADGIVLAADLALPAAPRAAAVLCHPHPAYGGDRHNIVVDALFRALPAAGLAALRFDFRGAGGGEQDDVLAALDRLAGDVPGVPLWLVGYSFGADVALGVDDPRLAGWVAVAPPLRFGSPPVPAGGDPRPVLVLVPEHDAYSPPDRIRPATDAWPAVTVEVVPMADHFLVGAAAGVAATVTAWLS
jgi:alpha/beta superfamily hydrolase